MENKEAFPSTANLDIIKSWVMYNIADIVTFHIEELAIFRHLVK